MRALLLMLPLLVLACGGGREPWTDEMRKTNVDACLAAHAAAQKRAGKPEGSDGALAFCRCQQARLEALWTPQQMQEQETLMTRRLAAQGSTVQDAGGADPAAAARLAEALPPEMKQIAEECQREAASAAPETPVQ